MTVRSIRRRLLTSVLWLVSVPLLTVGSLMGWFAYQQSVDEALARQGEIARRVAVQAQAYLQQLQFMLESSRQLTGFAAADAQERLRILERILANRHRIREIASIGGRNGSEIHLSNKRLIPSDHSHSAVFDRTLQAVLETQTPSFSGVYFDPQNNEPLMLLGVPVTYPGDPLSSGAIIAEVRLKPLWNLIAALDLVEGEDVYLLDNEDRVIAHRNPSVVLSGQHHALDPLLDRQQSLLGGMAFTRMHQFQLGGRGFRVVAEREMEAALGPALDNALVSGAIVLVSLLGATIMVVLVAGRLSRPIVVMAETARAIREGDLERRVEVKRDDEIGGLAQAFNAMTDRLSESLDKLKSEIRQRRDALNELEKVNRSYLALSMSNRAVARATDEQQLLDEACRIVKENCGYRLVWIGLAEDDEHKTVRPVAEAGFSDGYLQSADITWADSERGQGPTGIAIRERRPEFCRDIGNNPRFAPWREQALQRGYASTGALPLVAGERALGALMVYAAETDAFVEEEVRLLSELAENIAFGVSKLRDQEELAQYRGHLERLVKQRTAELQRQQSFLQAVLENIADGVVACDENGLLSLFNRATREIHGIGQEQLPSERWAEHYRLYHADGKTLMTRDEVPLFRAFQGATIRNEEMVIVHRDGSRRIIVASGQAIFDDEGNKLGAVASMHDVTAQKRATEAMKASKEIAEAANRAKSVFLANMSHELRTPLNAILGFAQLMSADQRIPEDQRENLETINRSGSYLLSLINDVLEISKIEAGRLTLNPEIIDLPELLTNVAEVMRIRAEQKGLLLHLEISPEVPRYVCIDETKLRQVVMNLLSNALKYTREGQVRLLVSCRGQEDPPQLFVDVSDTGTGIAADDMERIFQPFYQTDQGIAVGEGTGLGLTICREYAELMGGELTAQSRPGQGSVFHFRVPVETTELPAEVEEAPGDVVGLVPGQPTYRILVAEDNPDNQRLISNLLEGVGLSVQVAANGEEAIRMTRSWHPHFIWMDMRMPILDGYRATRRIKAMPECAGVKIAALTASAFEEDRQDIIDAGCDAFVRKPVQAAELFRVMGDLLGLRYRHEKNHRSSRNANRLPDAKAVRALPEELRQSLRDAAEQLDVYAMNQIIGEIRNSSEPLAASLEALVGEFRFDLVLQVLQAPPLRER